MNPHDDEFSAYDADSQPVPTEHRRSLTVTDQPTKYRKKPVVIDAVHWRENLTPPEAHALTNIIEREWGYPWLVGNALRPDTDGALMIRTLEGDMKVSPGDYIIRGVVGEVYPIKPDIFAATYEPADADDHAQPEGETHE